LFLLSFSVKLFIYVNISINSLFGRRWAGLHISDSAEFDTSGKMLHAGLLEWQGILFTLSNAVLIVGNLNILVWVRCEISLPKGLYVIEPSVLYECWWRWISSDEPWQ
jgi:hypothetical protein